jgi:tripartite-type tricarboxylate transporter receptor subunit TctC
MMHRRRFTTLAAGAALAAALPRRSRAQPIIYPARFVRLVVPFAPAGGADVIGRLLAARLSEIWGQQVVIENKGGAGGNIAAEFVARSEPDGYTLFLPSLGHAINRSLFPSLNYDPVEDFSPISLVCQYPNIMVVPNSSPAHSVSEFIAYAKANRGKISFASSSTGTSVHLCGELFKRATGIEMTHVPYRGAGPAYNDVIPGRIDVMFATSSSGLPMIQGGKLRGLGVTALKRQAWAPDLPTLDESGVPGFEVSSWYGLFAPARTPPEIVAKINADTIKAVHDPDFVERLYAIATTAVGSSPEDLARHLQSEMDKWGPVIREASIKSTE